VAKLEEWAVFRRSCRRRCEEMLWDKFCDIVDKINSKLGYVLSFSIVVMLVIMLYEVISRYIFNHPTTWAWRVNSMIFSATLILGGGYVLLLKGHVKLDLIYERVSSAKKRLFDIITFPIFLIFIVLAMWQGWKMAASSIALREHPLGFFQPPLYYNKIIFVIGVVLLFLEGLAIFIRKVRNAEVAEEQKEEIQEVRKPEAPHDTNA
jgi:TRAP-type mannitol/chloroaromatic compound transport system permease small subunit